MPTANKNPGQLVFGDCVRKYCKNTRMKRGPRYDHHKHAKQVKVFKPTRCQSYKYLENITFRVPVTDADRGTGYNTWLKKIKSTYVAETDGNHSSGYPATPFLTIFL